MALDRENILQKQEKLRLLNQPLLGQDTALQNNSIQMEGDPEEAR